MDLPLLRALRCIKKIEDENPSFRTEKIDLASFKPMYPNQIIVDQNAKCETQVVLDDTTRVSYSILSEDESKMSPE